MEILCLETLIGTYFDKTEKQIAKGRLFPDLLRYLVGGQHVSSEVLVAVACLLRWGEDVAWRPAIQQGIGS
jgi:hypothetical protein